MLLTFGIVLLPRDSQAITLLQADSAYNAYYKVYWNSSNNTFYKSDVKTGLIDFWRYAHCWEAMMDRYDLTHDTVNLRQMKQAWTGFNATNGMGTTWSKNSYNDDIAWWILAAGRAYLLTNDTAYSNAAKRNFDWMYSTQCDAVLGGGIYWRNAEHGEKNSCVNGPAICGAVELYWIFNDTAYLNKAKSLYAWERKTLWNSGSGVVADRIMVGSTSSIGGAITYNEGTFIGAAYRLFKATRDSSYYRDAILTMNYVHDHMCNSAGVISNGGLTGDAAGFLVVLVHHMMYFVIDGKQNQYLSWVTLNAETAWKNRRQSDNIVSSAWNNVPSSTVESSSCAGGVGMINLAVLANNPTAVSRPKEFVENNNPDYGVSIYQNPAQKTLMIRSGNLPADATYIITNAEGKDLLKGRLDGNKIDVRALKSGVYFIKLTGKDLTVGKMFRNYQHE
jgi:predicted alpha-1,6-mannanase (GH76 family)